MSIRSRHSRRMVSTKRSAKALARNARIGVRMIRMSSERKTSSKLAGELGVTIADQELDRLRTLADLIGEIPGLLDHPCSGWIGGDPGQIHPAGVQLDEEENVEPPQQHGIHREEVTGQHRRGLGLQELIPGGPDSVRGRVEAVTLEDVPDALRCQADTQDGKLPADPPPWPGAPLPERSRRGPSDDRWPSGRSTCVEP